MTDLKELMKINALSSQEGPVRNFFFENLKENAFDIRTDNVGNIICYKKGTGQGKRPVVVVTGHMDEVGLVVKGYDEDGSLLIGQSGEVSPLLAVGRNVVIGENRINAITYCTGDSATDYSVIRADIGASAREEAQQHVDIGDMIYFDEPIVSIGDDFIMGKAIDDRASVGVMLDLVNRDEEYPYDLYVIPNVQEEVFLRGSQALRYLEPDVTIVLEGTFSDDLPYIDESMRSTVMGNGVVLNIMDMLQIFDYGLLDLTIKAAEENGIPWQYKNVAGAGNDGCTFQMTGKGSRVVSFSVPVRNIHSASSMCSNRDYIAMHDLVDELLKKLSDTETLDYIIEGRR